MENRELVEVVNKVIAERRSVYPKHFSGEQIPDADVEKIMENANWAPTHKYTEPWRFVVFKGDAIVELVNAMEDYYLTDAGGEISDRKINKFKYLPEKCSHIIAIVMQRDEELRVAEFEEISAVAMAVQNIYLTSHAMGHVGYWSTGNGTQSETMHEFLDLKSGQTLLGYFFLGKPARNQPDGFRRDWKEKVTWRS